MRRMQGMVHSLVVHNGDIGESHIKALHREFAQLKRPIPTHELFTGPLPVRGSILKPKKERKRKKPKKRSAPRLHSEISNLLLRVQLDFKDLAR